MELDLNRSKGTSNRHCSSNAVEIDIKQETEVKEEPSNEVKVHNVGLASARLVEKKPTKAIKKSESETDCELNELFEVGSENRKIKCDRFVSTCFWY